MTFQSSGKFTFGMTRRSFPSVDDLRRKQRASSRYADEDGDLPLVVLADNADLLTALLSQCRGVDRNQLGPCLVPVDDQFCWNGVLLYNSLDPLMEIRFAGRSLQGAS